MKLNKKLKKLVSGQMFANIGDILYTVAVISSIFSLTNSSVAAAMTPVIMTGSSIVSGLFTPLLINRYSLPQILKATQTIKTVFLTGLVLYVQGNIQQPNLFVLYFFVACIAFFDGCADPVSRALIPIYVENEELLRVNAMFNTMLQIVSIGSWAVGSTLLLVLTVPQLMWLDLLFFVVSTILMWMLNEVDTLNQSKEDTWTDFSIGWKTIYSNKTVGLITLLELLARIADTAWISAIILVLVRDVLQATPNWWGYINAAYFVGALLGSLLVLRFSEYIDKNTSAIIYYGFLFSAIVTALVIIAGSKSLVLVCSLLIGAFLQLKNIPLVTILQDKISSNSLAQVYVATNILNIGIFSITSILMSYIADKINVQAVFVLSATILFIAAIITQRNKKKLS